MAVLTAELGQPRLLTSPWVTYSEQTTRELAILVEAAAAVGKLGPAMIPHYVISMCRSVSDVLEVAVLLKEVGLLQPAAHRPAPDGPQRDRGSRPTSCRCSRPSMTWPMPPTRSGPCCASRRGAPWSTSGAAGRR